MIKVPNVKWSWIDARFDVLIESTTSMVWEGDIRFYGEPCRFGMHIKKTRNRWKAVRSILVTRSPRVQAKAIKNLIVLPLERLFREWAEQRPNLFRTSSRSRGKRRQS